MKEKTESEIMLEIFDLIDSFDTFDNNAFIRLICEKGYWHIYQLNHQFIAKYIYNSFIKNNDEDR